MWLASVSLHDKRGEIISTNTWSSRQFRQADRIARQALHEAGDENRERTFRMCMTFCIHRGIRDDELAIIPRWWHEADAIDIAGGPLEMLSSKGVPDVLSAKPCYSPGKRPIAPRRPDLYFPVDCGACPPCVARKNVRTLGPLQSGVYKPEDIRPLSPIG